VEETNSAASEEGENGAYHGSNDATAMVQRKKDTAAVQQNFLLMDSIRV
jgi:hypothetical protein